MLLKWCIKKWLSKRNYFLFWVPPGSPSGVGLEWDLRRIMDSTDPVVLDVGANVGQTIDLITSLYPRARIVAFEPSSKICEQLKRTHGCRCRHVYQTALGRHDEIQEFINYEKSVFSSLLKFNPSEAHQLPALKELGGEQVNVRRLDGMFAEWDFDSIDLLKIDTQGNDLNVLLGAEGLFETRRIRRVLVELNFFQMYESEGDAYAIITFLRQQGLHLVELYEKHRHGTVITWCTGLFELEAGGGVRQGISRS